MSHERIYASRPDVWVRPRPYSDANMRRLKHGPIVPMQQKSWIERTFGA